MIHRDVENIYRHMEEEGLGPFEAALKESRNRFTIISIHAVSLIAVFVPVLLMAASWAASQRICRRGDVAIVASPLCMTLTPMLASRILSRRGRREANRTEPAFRGGVRRPHAPTAEPCRPACAINRGCSHCFCHAGRHGLAHRGDAEGALPQRTSGSSRLPTEARQDVSFEAMSACKGRSPTLIASRHTLAGVASIVVEMHSTMAGFSSSSSLPPSVRDCARCWPTFAATPRI